MEYNVEENLENELHRNVETDTRNITANEDGTFGEVKERLARLEKLYEKSERSNILLKKKLNAERKKMKDYKNYISKVFQDDQLKLLSGLYKKVPHWCHETILEALKLRFSCSTAGYEELLRQSFPLPSIRTLTKKMENIKFNGGISEEIFQFLHL